MIDTHATQQPFVAWTKTETHRHHHHESDPCEQHRHDPEPMREAEAQQYVEEHGDLPTNHLTVDLAGIRPTDRVLDVGCDPGAAVREAAKLAIAGEVIGVEPSKAMLRIAKEKATGTPNEPRIRSVLGSAEDLPMDSDTISVVTAIHSVRHWRGLEVGLSEALRVLVPGGKLLVTEELYGASANEPTEEDGLRTIVSAAKRAGYVDLEASVHAFEDVRVGVLQGLKPEGGVSGSVSSTGRGR